MKKTVKEALLRAKKLEARPLATRDQISAIYKDGLANAQKLGKLLKPAWFVSDKHTPKAPPGKKILGARKKSRR